MTFIRYTTIQLLAYGIDMGFFLMVLKSGLFGPVAANVLAKLAAGMFAFIVHRRFTFRVDKSANIRHHAIRYFLLLAINVPIASAILALILALMTDSTVIKLILDRVCVVLSCELNKSFIFTGGLPVMAKFIADVVCVVLSYKLSKHFVFTGQQGKIKANGEKSTGVGA